MTTKETMLVSNEQEITAARIHMKVWALNSPLFTQHELCAVTNIDQATANNWVERGIVLPEPPDHRRISRQRFFSIMEIMKARVINELVTQLAIPPSNSAEIAELIFGGERKQIVLDAVESTTPMDVCAYAKRKDGKWVLELYFRDVLGAYPDRRSYLVIPLSHILVPVYTKCKQMVGLQ